MNKAILLVILAIALCPLTLIADEYDASYSMTYGSDSVGAEKIIFDSNGGSGGYAQYVLNGNTILFPTEYKKPGPSNTSYSAIHKTDYVLLGWSESRTATIPQYYPGQSYTVTSDRTFYAVWGDLTYDCIEVFGGQEGVRYTEAQHSVAHIGSDPGLIIGNDTGAYVLMVAATERTGFRYTLTVEHNGIAVTSETTSRNVSISADWLTLNISNSGEFSFSGMPAYSGIYSINVQMQTKGIGNVYGEYEDLECRWYVSAVDPNSDASDMLHVTYEGEDIGYGPYHTAVKLPDAVSKRQKGWNVVVDGSPAIFPVGGSYSTVIKETVLTASEYTYDEISAAGVVGIMAYNANGGFYTGAFAELVPVQGYKGLKGGDIVSKEGCTFLGWNLTGSPTDPIYPVGYLYDIEEEYTEMKAVWAESKVEMFKVHLVNPSDGNQNTSIDVAAGYHYMLPVHGFEASGYEFIGWSNAENPVGKGLPTESEIFEAEATKTYYAVYRPVTYTVTIHYDAGAGQGTMSDQTEFPTSMPHYMTVLGSTFTMNGYEFQGWAESKYADSPSLREGDQYCFTESGKVTLYAVWKAKSEGTLSIDKVEYVEISRGNYFKVTLNEAPVNGVLYLYIDGVLKVRQDINQKDVAIKIDGSFDASRQTYRVVVESVMGDDEYPDAPDVPDTKYLYTLLFVANGQGATNVPSGAYRITTAPSESFYVPSTAPQREGYRFMGWSDTPTGLAVYEPGSKVTLRVAEGKTSAELTLYAVWEASNPDSGAGAEVTVTFVGDSGTIRTVKVTAGNPVGQISAPAKDGYAFFGWYRDSAKWDFSTPVDSDMTLNASYLKVFHLDIAGCDVKPVIDCPARSVKVTYSDGFSGSYDSTTIPAHTVVSGTSGSVSVTVDTESGTHSAVCHYAIPAEAEHSENQDKVDGTDWKLIGIASAAIAAIFVLIWRFFL